jgi:hypothetical protein
VCSKWGYSVMDRLLVVHILADAGTRVAHG